MWESIIKELESSAISDREAEILALKLGVDVEDLSDTLDDMAIDFLPF